jgi:tetratricopeptide (TPR) repeat protein
MTERIPQRLDDAVAAARAGQREQAHTLLQDIVRDDPNNADAWVWLGGVEADPAAQYRALEHAVALDPGNQRAREGLRWLDQKHPDLSLNAASNATTLPMGVPDVGDVYADDVIPPGADPELRCPYCGEWTLTEDTSCPRCQYPLIVNADRSVGAAITRWFLALVWLIVGAAAGVGAYFALEEAGRIAAGASRIAVSAVALGGAPPLGNALPPAMLLQLANGTVVAGAVLATLSAIFVLGMLFRWRAVYVLQVITTVLLIAAVGALIAVLWSGGRLELDAVTGFNADVLVMWALGPTLIGLIVLLLLTLASRREFFPRRVRVRLPDEQVSAREHFRRGRHYQGNGWLWAAAREYERAVEQNPGNKRYNRALANIYAIMGDDSEGQGDAIDFETPIERRDTRPVMLDESHGR